MSPLDPQPLSALLAHPLDIAEVVIEPSQFAPRQRWVRDGDWFRCSDRVPRELDQLLFCDDGICELVIRSAWLRTPSGIRPQGRWVRQRAGEELFEVAP